MPIFQKPDHSHSKCVDAAQRRFEEKLAASDKRMGVHVQEIFEILLRQHRSFTAYEIVDAMVKKGKKLQATQVYRALETLIELGNIHRIESKNAYVACHNGDGCKQPQLLICDSCNSVAEINSGRIEDSIAKTAHSSGFVVQNRQVEITGLCPNCA